MIPTSILKSWEIPKHETLEFKAKHSKYCVCVPVINEGVRLQAQLQKMSQISQSIDILILDGGSSDGSCDSDTLRKAGVRTLLVKRDQGKLGAQLRMGYAYALKQGYLGIITIDGNNKDNPEAIEHFQQALEQGADFIQGSRFIFGGKAINTPWIRLLAIKLIHAPLVSLLAGYHYTDTTNGFRAYSSALMLDQGIQPFRKIFSGYELLFYLSIKAARLGYKIKELPVTRTYPANCVPTKISPLRGNLALLKNLLLLLIHYYDPKINS